MRSTFLVLVVAMATVLAGCTQESDPPGGGGGTTPATNVAPAPPVPSFSVSPANGGADTLFTFDAAATKDPNGDLLKYEWEIGSLARKVGVKVTHKFGFTDATVPVKLTVTDAGGLSASLTKRVALGTGRNAEPQAAVVASPAWVKPGEAVAFDASASTDPDGDALVYAFGWKDASLSVNVDSGDIPKDGRWSYTYAQEGVFRQHCHPHPTMKHNVTVSKDAPAASKVEVVIQGFKFVPENVAVRPGTSVTYVNKDPVAHTVTLEAFEAPLTPIPATGAKGSFTFPSDGKYAIVAVVTDGKGTISTAEATVLVDSNRPDPVFARSWSGKINASLVPGTALGEAPRASWKLDHPGKGQANVTFTSQVPDQQLTLTVERSDGGADTYTIGPGGSPLVLLLDLDPGTWSWVLTAERAVQVDYTVDLRLDLELTPPDEGGGDDGHGGHAH